MHHDQAELIAKSLGGATRSGDNWSCRCPAHDDKHASLSIKQAPSGKLLVHCHAGCEQDSVIGQLKQRGQWPNGSANTAVPDVGVHINYDTLGKAASAIVDQPSSTEAVANTGIEQIYQYVDEHGEIRFECVRMKPKSFRQRRPLENGEYVWSIKDVVRIPYNLPAVLQGIRDGEPIYIVEGEKDVETARKLGLVATCNPMGADNGTGNKWFKEWGAYFKGGEVIIIPDQDEAGFRHAKWVRSTLNGYASNVFVVIPKVGKDLSDWVEAGADQSAIEQDTQDFDTYFDAYRVEKNATLNNTPCSNIFLRVEDLVDNIKPIEWLIEDFVERDSLTLIYGAPASGKSLLSMDWACCIATGTAWLGKHDVEKGGAYYVAAEGLNGLSRRFRAWSIGRKQSLKGAPLYQSSRGIQVLDRNSVLAMVADIEAIVEQTGTPPMVAVIDTVARSFGAGDENSTEDMSNFIQNIDELIRKRFHITIILVHHSGHTEGRARGSSALRAAMDSEFEVANDSGNVQIRCTKMKEAEIAPDVYLRIRGVDLGIIDRKGHAVTGGLLDEPDDLINTKVGEDKDGNDLIAHEVLAVLQRGWLSIREMMTAFNCTKNQAEKVIKGLTRFEFIHNKQLTQIGVDSLSRTGHFIAQKDKPLWQRKGGDSDEKTA